MFYGLLIQHLASNNHKIASHRLLYCVERYVQINSLNLLCLLFRLELETKAYDLVDLVRMASYLKSLESRLNSARLIKTIVRLLLLANLIYSTMLFTNLNNLIQCKIDFNAQLLLCLGSVQEDVNYYFQNIAIGFELQFTELNLIKLKIN
ncbi:hypothetical protein BpHYR1_040282 [Brachionus plicatilis]|uniref:Uncharacterized protein n=1 Tax=Brachionus plicatilis TaxID=10195 RepID=A0A3M7R867_BRAPC|nr:hypothetical protein BpHYR1_040282 [Brachionus plicatilis]